MIGPMPSYLFYYFFSWVFTTSILRYKSALNPYPSVRGLLLRRSGVKIGRDVEINSGNLIFGRGRKPPALTLGDRVALGPNISFITSSYPSDSLLGRNSQVQGMIKRFAPINIEDDAWIGAGVIILPGVTIGRCSIVGAGAVVTKDVAPYSVMAGVPARVIRTLTPE